MLVVGLAYSNSDVDNKFLEEQVDELIKIVPELADVNEEKLNEWVAKNKTVGTIKEEIKKEEESKEEKQEKCYCFWKNMLTRIGSLLSVTIWKRLLSAPMIIKIAGGGVLLVGAVGMVNELIVGAIGSLAVYLLLEGCIFLYRRFRGRGKVTDEQLLSVKED